MGKCKTYQMNSEFLFFFSYLHSAHIHVIKKKEEEERKDAIPTMWKCFHLWHRALKHMRGAAGNVMRVAVCQHRWMSWAWNFPFSSDQAAHCTHVIWLSILLYVNRRPDSCLIVWASSPVDDCSTNRSISLKFIVCCYCLFIHFSLYIHFYKILQVCCKNQKRKMKWKKWNEMKNGTWMRQMHSVSWISLCLCLSLVCFENKI